MTVHLEFVVFADGEQQGWYGNPYSAIQHAVRLKEADTDQAVVVVVLDREEAELTAEEHAHRPFYTPPAQQATQVIQLPVTADRDSRPSTPRVLNQPWRAIGGFGLAPRGCPP